MDIRRRDLLSLSLSGAFVSQFGLLPVGAGATGTDQMAASSSANSSFGRARNVIVMYCWGGMSHIDTFDMKPEAGSEIRGEFQPVSTSVPGIQISEHLPQMGKMLQHLAIIRSVHHKAGDHRMAAYWNLTGHMPVGGDTGVAPAVLPSRSDWPSLGAQVAMAMADDRRYRKRKDVKRLRSEDIVPSATKVNWDNLRRVSTVCLSTDVVGAGQFSAGSFRHQDGYTNNGTVELIGMIAASEAGAVPITRDPDGPTADVSAYVASDGTAGGWGSDEHGRGGFLWLIGDSETRGAHKGFGCHANKFITLNLEKIREKNFGGSKNAFVLTCRVGVNGDPGVHESAAGQVGVWVDGKLSVISQTLRRDDPSQLLEAVVRPDAKYLTLAALNGDHSTFYDDMAMRDVDLIEVEGELPAEVKPTVEEPPTSQVADDLAANLPRTISIPYPLADRGLLNGQYGGFLGLEYDPVFVNPGEARRFRGISPSSGTIDLTPHGISRWRLAERGELLDGLNSKLGWTRPNGPEFSVKASQDQAINMLLSPEVQLAFDVSQEEKKTREMYGTHVSGRSALLGRRLADAGVPLVTVNVGVGDLNGAQGDHWDTHGNNFNRLKNDLLPYWDHAASALLTDLHQSGRIDDTLVVFLTEFGRTPRINSAAGRDHFPSCYSVLFAGAGVTGGTVLGKSDKTASRPVEAACTPADIHATIFHALGIPPGYHLRMPDGRPIAMCDGTKLPVF